MKKTPRKKKSNKISNPEYEVVELPRDNSDMEKYVQENRKEINNKKLSSSVSEKGKEDI